MKTKAKVDSSGLTNFRLNIMAEWPSEMNVVKMARVAVSCGVHS